MRRLKQLNLTFLNAVDLSFKFDRPGRIMHAKCDVVSDVALYMHVPNSINLPVLLVDVVQPANGKLLSACKTSCNAYEWGEIGHMFF